MKKYRLPLIEEQPIPSDVEASLPQPIEYYYLATEVDALVTKLKNENARYSRQLFAIGQVLGEWATGKHSEGKTDSKGNEQ